MSLKNNNITHICCLKNGDRFYLANDIKKIVWQVDYHMHIWFKGIQKKATWCKTDNAEKKRFLSNRVIILLKKETPKVRGNIVLSLFN